MDVWGYRLANATSWRNAVRLWLLAVRPFCRAGWGVVLVAALALVMVGLAAVVTFAQQGNGRATGSSSWIEERLDSHEDRMDQETEDLAVVKQQLRENERRHKGMDDMRLAERMATVEANSRLTVWLLGIILACMGPLIGESLFRFAQSRK